MIGIYRYKIKLMYIIDNKEYIFDTKNIHNLLIDYDYDNKNRPILFMKLSIDKNILDDMIKNKDNNTITLVINKYNTTSNFHIEEEYIKSEFIYFLSEDINYQRDLDYAGSEKNTEDKFKIVNLGMMKKELIDNNKVLINDIIIDTNMMNIVYKHMSHMNLLIEPFKDQQPIKRFIIPPITTISKFIEYLDSYNNLYDSKYRLFFDHNRTYLISSSGESIKAKNEDYFTVIININNTTTEESKYQGMKIDNFTNSYIIDLDTTNIEVHKNKDIELSRNTIIGVDNDGNIKKAYINNDSLEKIKVERITNNNLNKVEQIKEDLETNTTINIVKTDLDTSAITINKQYNLKNYVNLKDNDGKYLLSRKREIYVREGEEFILTNILTLKKIES